MRKSTRPTAEAKIRMRYLKVKGELTERARRLFVASEAMVFGHGSIAAASRATGMAASVIGRGLADIRAIEAGTAPPLAPARSRRPGGGRKEDDREGPHVTLRLAGVGRLDDPG